MTVYVGSGESTADEGVFSLTIPGDEAAKLVASAGKIVAAASLSRLPFRLPSLEYVVVP